MSHPWPFAANRHAKSAGRSVRGLVFEGLESRVLLSAEVGIPPPDPALELAAAEALPLHDAFAHAASSKAASVPDQVEPPTLFSVTEQIEGGSRYVFTDDDLEPPDAWEPDGTADVLDFSGVTLDLRFVIGDTGITVRNYEDPDNPEDIVTGATGIEHLIGGSGDDTFFFEDSAIAVVSIRGGEGSDTLDYSTYGEEVEVDLGTGEATGVSGAAGGSSPAAFAVLGVENLISSAAGSPAPSAAGDAPDLRGSREDNRFESGAGNDDFAGAGGDDRYVFDDGWGTDRVRESAGSGDDTLDFSRVSTGLEFTAGPVADGEPAVDRPGWTVTVQGGGPSPTLAATHVETLIGGAGNDRFLGVASDTEYRFVVADGTDGWGEDIVRGDTGEDTLDFSAFDGNLIFELRALDASDNLGLIGAGPATVLSAGALGIVVYRDEDGDGQRDGSAVVTASGIEQIVAGGGDNTFYIADGTTFTGTIRGSFGGRNTLDYSSWQAGVTVDLQDGTASGIDGGAFDFHNVIGGAGNDTLRGNVFDNELTGGGGDDLLDGRAGSDTAAYRNAAAGVTVDLRIAGPQDTGSGLDTLTGIENLVGSPEVDVLTGDSSPNRLEGGDGDDTLVGGDGDDTLAGGEGDDELRGDAGIDTVSYRDATTAVTVDLGADGPQDTSAGPQHAGAGDDTLVDLENVIGPGFGVPGASGFGGTFSGTAGPNRFYIAAGNASTNTVINGDADDWLVLDARGGELSVPVALASFQITNIDTDGDGTGDSQSATVTINGSLNSVLLQNTSEEVPAAHMTELGNRLSLLAEVFDRLEGTGAFGLSIPLADPGGASFGELLEFGRVLRRLAEDFTKEFDGSDADDDGEVDYPASTTAALRRFFTDWAADFAGDEEDGLVETREWLARTLEFTDRLLLDAAGEISELQLHQRFTNARLSFIDVSESAVLRDSGVAALLGSGFELISGFDVDFTIGIEQWNRTSLGSPDPEFFVDAGTDFRIEAFAELRDGQSEQMGTLERIGFLGGSSGGTIALPTTLGARASTTLDPAADPGSDNRIRGLHLDVANFFAPADADGEIDADMPFESAERLDATDGDESVGLDSGNFFDNPVTPSFSGFAADFTLATPGELLRMLGQLGGWLGALGQADILDLTIPFVGSTTLGDALGFGQAFGEEMLRYLTRHDGLRLAGSALENGRLSDDASDQRLVSFTLAIQPEDGAEQYVHVELRAGETAFNSSAGELRAQIEQALLAGAARLVPSQRALAEQIEVRLVEGRIEFRPVAGARDVAGVSLPRIGNESLGFDGRRLVVPRSLLAVDLFDRDHIGTLGHELELTLNVGGTVVTATVVRAEHDSIDALIGDIQASVNAALELEDPGTAVTVTARLVDGDRIELSAIEEVDTDADGDVDGDDEDRAVEVVLTEVREPAVLVPELLSLGVESASFPTAQLLAEQLEAVINRQLEGAELPVELEVDFNTVTGEISLRVDLSREFDVFNIPFDLGVDLGGFVSVETAGALGLTASVDLGFEFGVDLTPQQELVVAPPVFQPDLPADGRLATDAHFGFDLHQRNFESDRRLSTGPLRVGLGLGFDVTVGVTTDDVGWSAPIGGRLVDEDGAPLPDQHFFLRVRDAAAPAEPGTVVAGVLRSHDTLDNASIADLADDLRDAITVALASSNQRISVAIADADADGFTLAATADDPAFDGRFLTLITAEEFLVARIDDVTVTSASTATNSSVSDLVADAQAALDERLAAAGLGPIADPLLGFDGEITVIGDGEAAVAELDAPADGVLSRDVRFTIRVDGGEPIRGIVRAADTATNGSTVPDGDASTPDTPLEALAGDVERAITAALGSAANGSDAIVVEVHPPLGLGPEPTDLIAGAAPEIASGTVPANGVLDHDVLFTLTVGGTTISGAVRAHATTTNDSVGDLAADVTAAINASLRSAGNNTLTVTVGAEENSDRLNFAVSGGNLAIDFSPTIERRLQIRALQDFVFDIRFENPQVLAAHTGDRISLTALPSLETFEGENPADGDPPQQPVVLARRVGVQIANFGDPAYQNLGLLSSPVPLNGVLTGTAQFTIVVDGTNVAVSVAPDTTNGGVQDLIDDINAALDTALSNAGLAENAVQARRVQFVAEIAPGVELVLHSNRFEFFTDEASGIREISLPALTQDPNQPANTAITQLGFDTEDEHSARVQVAEFFIRDATFDGQVRLSANGLEGSALVGFGQGLGVGVEFSGRGAVVGSVSLDLLNPAQDPADPDDDTRVTLETLWREIGRGNLDGLVDADISGVVDIDLRAQPVLLGRTPLAPITVTLDLDIEDWLGAPPVLDDAADPNGIQVNVSGLDLSIYDALSNLSFGDVTAGLREVLEFLVDLQGEDGNLARILEQPLPLLNQSPNELLVIADRFALLVDEVTANPARSLQRLETTLENLLGLPEELVTLSIDRAGESLALRVDLVFGASVDTAFGFDLDLRDLVAMTAADSPARALLDGLGNFVGVSSTGDLGVGVDGRLRLSFGIDLGESNGSAEALGFRDGDTDTGRLAATGDAQAAANRLVDQDVVFELRVGGETLTVTVTAGEATREPVEVDGDTRISELAAELELVDGPELVIRRAGGGAPLAIDLGDAGDDPTIDEVLAALGVSGIEAELVDRAIVLTDTSTLSSESQSGVFVPLTGIAEFQAVRFALIVGTNHLGLPADPVNVAVDAAQGITRKEWLKRIEEAIRAALVDAGQLNPVADAVVAVAYNAIASGGQLTFQGTGDGIGDRLTIYSGRGASFVVDNARNTDGVAVSSAGSALGLLPDDGTAARDADGDRTITGRELRTDEPADTIQFLEDVRRAVREALQAEELALDTVTVALEDVELDDEGDFVSGHLVFTAADSNAALSIHSIESGPRPFLYNGSDGTALLLSAEATGRNLDFTAQVGPFGFYVIDGSAELSAFFEIALGDTGALDGRTFFSDEFAVTTDYGGSATASLPLYFPDDSTPVDDFANALEITISRLQDFLGSVQSDGSISRASSQGSVAIDTPDLTAFPTPTLIGMLSNPEFLIDGLDAILQQIQDALDGEVFGVTLPLVGDGLAPAGQFIADFRDDVLGYLSIRLRQGGLNPVTIVQETLYNIFAGESDGDIEALTVLGFDSGDEALGVLQAGGVLTSGALARDAAFNLRVGRDAPVRITVARSDVAGERPEDLVAALNDSLLGRGLADQLTAGYRNVAGGFVLTLSARDGGAAIAVDTAGAIPLDIFGLEIGGLDLLRDGNADGVITLDDILKTGFGLTDDYGQFDVLLGDDYTFSRPLDFDLGLPILEFDLDAGVQVDIGWDFAFGFGVSQEDGFYFVTDSELLEGEEEIQVEVDVGLLGVLGFTPGATAEPGDDGRAVLAASTDLPEDGRLGRDLEFTLLLGDRAVEARVTVAQASGNHSRADLAADVEAALDNALGADRDRVTARLRLDDAGRATGQLEIVATGGGPLTIYDRATAFGRLGFLALDVLDGGREIVDPATDPEIHERDYTRLELRFGVDLRDPNDDDDRLSFAEMSASSTSLSDILVAGAEGLANVNLGLLVSFDGLGIDAAMIPAIGTDLGIEWTFSFNTADGVEIGAPDVSFEAIQLDLGTFITDFAGPFLSDLAEVLEPLDFLLDRSTGLLYRRLPVISDLAGETVTLIDLAAVLDRDNQIMPFVQAVEQVYFLANLVSDAAAEARANGGSIRLDFGTISLSGLGADGVDSLDEATVDDSRLAADPVGGFNSGSSASGSTQSFTRTVTRPGPGTVDFRILEPATIVSLLLGEPDVPLIEYDLPPFGFNFEYLQRFPIYPPLFATLRGAFSATVDLGFGFDTLGLSQFRSSGNPLDLFNGFYVTDLVDGVDVPEVVLDGTIAAGVSLDVAVASAGVEGGLNALIFFNLNDPNVDGRVRLGEMLGNMAINYYNPISVFDTSGRFDAFLRAYVEVLFGLWSAEYEIGRVTLATFNVPFNRIPLLASDTGNGTLQLNIGEASRDRIHGSLQDGDQTISARYQNGSVYVSSPGVAEQRYIGVSRIVVNGGAGNDTIDLTGLAGSGIEVEMHGGDGNDTLRGAAGSRNTIFGDAGNDLLVGGSLGDVLDGGEGNDRLEGRGGDDELAGGGGNDLLQGGDGADSLDGGGGDDRLDGGAGDDRYDFGVGFGDDTVIELTTSASGSGGRDSWNFDGISSDLAVALGSDPGLTSVESVFALGNGEFRIRVPGHGLNSGDQIALAGLGLASPLSATVTVDTVDPDSILVTLPGAELAGDVEGIVQRTHAAVAVNSAVANDAETLRIRTATPHGLESGDVVRIGGIDPVTGRAVAGGSAGHLVVVTVVDARQFDVDRSALAEAALTEPGAFVQRTIGGSGLIDRIAVAAGVVTVTAADHGLAVGDVIAIYGLEGDAAVFNGRYRVGGVDPLGDSFMLTTTSSNGSPPLYDGGQLAGLADVVAEIDLGVWQLDRTRAATLGSSVTHFGFGIEVIQGGRGGDRFDIHQAGTEQVVLDGRGGSDTYASHAVNSAVSNGTASDVRLRDSGDFWDTDRTIYVGSSSVDDMSVDDSAVTAASGSRFEYALPDVVLGFESGATGTGAIEARFALESGELEQAARLLVTVGDGDPTLVVVEPGDVASSSIDDLVLALNHALERAEIDALLVASAPTVDGERRMQLTARDGTPTIALDNLSAGSGIEAFEVDAGAGNDSISVASTSARTGLRIMAGEGDDSIVIGGPQNDDTAAVTLRGIRGGALSGPLLVDGGFGDDRVLVTARDETAAVAGALDDRRISGLGMPIAIDYRGVEWLEIELGQGADQFVVERTTAGTTRLETGAGDDSVVVQDVAGTLDAAGGAGNDNFTVQGVSGTLNVGGGAGNDVLRLSASAAGSRVHLDGGDGSDAFLVEAMAGAVEVLGGAGDDVIVLGTAAAPGGASGDPGKIGEDRAVSGQRSIDGIQGSLSISGGAGLDTLDIEASGDPSTALSGVLGVDTATQRAVLSGLGSAGITFDTMGLVRIALGAGDDEFVVNATLNDEPQTGSTTIIDTGGGDDSIYVSDAAPGRAPGSSFLDGSLDDIAGELWIETGSGDNRLEISDRASASPDTAVVITANSITGLAPAPIHYATTGRFAGGIDILAGRGDDRIRVDSVLAGHVTSIYANAGNDALTLADAAAAIGGRLLVVHGEDGNDLIDGSAWAGASILFGDTGSVAFASADGDPGNIVVSSIVIGTDGNDVLTGGPGNDLLIGGLGADSLAGGPGNDVLLGDRGLVRIANGFVIAVEAIDLFNGSGDAIAGGAMNEQSRFGGDGHDVLIGGAGNDLFFGTLAEDVMIFEFGRVRFADGLALSAVVLGQRPLDLAASQMFDLYLKPALESPRYVVPPTEAADRPLRELETTVSTGDTEWSGTHGSGAAQVVSLPEVAFGYGSTAVPVDAEALLASISQLLVEFPGAVIEIAGHTDSTGGDAFNQALSQERADAVRDALIALGVDPARLRAVGYGESRPAADNGTEEGRERNRRVEISILRDADADADAANETADGTADETAALGVLALQGWRSARDGNPARRRRIEW